MPFIRLTRNSLRSQSAHDDCQCLRAGVPRLAGDHRQQHRERGVCRDGLFEHAHHRRGDKSREQVDLQPGQALPGGK
jgi:hypothetical protein